jgi:hypothetical protein
MPTLSESWVMKVVDGPTPGGEIRVASDSKLPCVECWAPESVTSTCEGPMFGPIRIDMKCANCGWEAHHVDVDFPKLSKIINEITRRFYFGGPQ